MKNTDRRGFLVFHLGGPDSQSPRRRDDLHQVIAAARRLPVHLIGLGLGEGTGHVSEFYPNARANIPPERFVEETAALMRQVIAGS